MNNENLEQRTDIPEEDFSYDGYQVVRGEFFSHNFEPTFTFNNYTCYINTACIKKLPEFDYIQILVNPDTKMLAVRPCLETEKDSFRWCSNTSKRTPKKITCRIFYAKLMNLMNWDNSHRYRLLGKLIRSNNDILFVFDLNSPEIFNRDTKNDTYDAFTKVPAFSADWKNHFGLPIDLHANSFGISTFDDYSVFSLKADSKKSHKESKKDSISISESIPELVPELIGTSIDQSSLY